MRTLQTILRHYAWRAGQALLRLASAGLEHAARPGVCPACMELPGLTHQPGKRESGAGWAYHDLREGACGACGR